MRLGLGSKGTYIRGLTVEEVFLGWAAAKDGGEASAKEYND